MFQCAPLFRLANCSQLTGTDTQRPGRARDGIFNTATRMGLSHFQPVKNLPVTGMMTTPTLNALGVPAVN